MYILHTTLTPLLLTCIIESIQQIWDPTSFELETREVKRMSSQRSLWAEDASLVSLEQSMLAHDCGCFPDDLFGGYAVKVKSLFGYSTVIDNYGREDNFQDVSLAIPPRQE